MSELDLLYPQWFWLLPLLAVGYWLHHKGIVTDNTQSAPALTVKHPFADEIEGVKADTRKTTPLFMAMTIILLMLLALAQPVRLGERMPAPPVPVDLMLIIDTSVSMVLKDYELDGKPVDRMTMTRALLDRFIQRYQGERIGLVVLGDKPHILLQPSKDHHLARHLVSRLQTTIAGRYAAIGDAVAVAATHIKDARQQTETVLVLISDAVLPLGSLSPLEGARRVAESGATLHTIAIGSTHMQEQVESGLIYEPADLELMQQMADITGGKSFHAVDVTAMDQALTSIEKQQSNRTTIQATQLKQALYIWPLGIAVLLMLVMSLKSYLMIRDASE